MEEKLFMALTQISGCVTNQNMKDTYKMSCNRKSLTSARK